MDRLKEIRDKYKSYFVHLDDVEISLPYPILKDIQQASYNLALDDIEKYIEKANTDLYGVDWVLTKDLLKQIASLKEIKK